MWRIDVVIVVEFVLVCRLLEVPVVAAAAADAPILVWREIIDFVFVSVVFTAAAAID